jgi:hypothetical protein
MDGVALKPGAGLLDGAALMEGMLDISWKSRACR